MKALKREFRVMVKKMSKLQKTGLILLILATLVVIKLALFPGGEQPKPPEEDKTAQEAVQKPNEENEDTLKSYVTVYFIGQNQNKEEVYKIVKRIYHGEEDGTKLKYAVNCLLQGPTQKEKTKGIYSEVPQGVKLLSIEESPEKVVINLSSNFEQGGGTDGLYKRLYQLIKTANKNTTLDVYLNLDGKQVDVIGGEGIMVNQPLNNKSLGE